MAYLFLDCTSGLLRSQYKRFSNKLKSFCQGFEHFMRSCFPEVNPRDYAISYPVFENRGLSQSEKTQFQFLKNVAIWPPQTMSMTSVLPDNLVLVALGDIVFSPLGGSKFIVNSIELIDKNSCPSESRLITRTTGLAMIAFKNATWSKDSDFAKNGVDFNDTCLTLAVAEQILKTIPTTNHTSARQTLNDWTEYVDFRSYWLDVQSKRSHPITGYVVEKAYSIPKQEYYEDKHSKFLLDNHTEFIGSGKNPIVYLSKSIDDAVEDVVVKVIYDCNKLEADENEEKAFDRFLRQPLKLVNSLDAEKGNGGKKKQAFALGEGRDNIIATIRSEVEPDYGEIERRFKVQKEQKKISLEKEYSKKLDAVVETFRGEKTAELMLALKKEVNTHNKKQESASLKDKYERLIDAAVQEKTNNERRLLWKEMDEKLSEVLKQLDGLEETAKDKLKRTQTIIRTEVYFKLEGDNLDPEIINNTLKEINPRLIAYDPCLEDIKLQRQADSLFFLKQGRVRNPLLAEYLFNPAGLTVTPVKVSEDTGDYAIDWVNKNLNPSQQKAVSMALDSTGLFLLQGPPGTGKTTVIAELTAQLVRRNLRVLIASETHKAVDNAFDEIEKHPIPEIRLLRLTAKTPGERNKETRWAMSDLTKNFYSSISENLRQSTEEYRNYKEDKEDFQTKLEALRVLNEQTAELKKKTVVSRYTIKSLEREINLISDDISKTNEQIGQCEDRKEQLLSVKRRLKEGSVSTNYLNDTDGTLAAFISGIKEARIEAGIFLESVADAKLLEDDLINNIDADLRVLNNPDECTLIDSEIGLVRARMQKCKNELDEIISGRESEYNELKARLIQLVNKKNSLDGVRKDSLRIYEYIKPDVLADENLRTTIIQRLRSFQERAFDIQASLIAKTDSSLNTIQEELDRLERKRHKLQTDKSGKEQEMRSAQENANLDLFTKKEAELKSSTQSFFRRYNIGEDYGTDYDEALRIIERTWASRALDFKRKKTDLDIKVRILNEINRYISGGAVERDQDAINRRLVDLATVFGITSTAGNKYSEEESKINLIEKDIDVVIIDEVSKSSFLDLLRPMLLGKKVILVGDHLQLPPMYDLKHLSEKKGDFEGLDNDKISEDINRRYTTMVETCFFKTLFEQVPDSYKVMLDRQYRFHSHIMDLNPFYGGKLKLGTRSLDDAKQHNLSIEIRGKSIIRPQDHVCFIDCGKSLEANGRNETSKINEGEASVVAALVGHINRCLSSNNPQSVGVICTYEQQAKLVKKKIKDNQRLFGKFKTTKESEPLVVSTVDSFQGDERDIIILSIVRNPEKGKRFDLEFIKSYQRLNVAITRPRKLLVIVGAMDFLSHHLEFTLPDGRKSSFESIVQSIMNNGHIRLMEDIISE